MANFAAYLKIDGLEGESQITGYEKWIEIESFNHGIAQPSAGADRAVGGGARGKSEHAAFGVVKYIDKTTPKLALFCSIGNHIKNIKLVITRAAGKPEKYMEYTLYDVLIESIRPGGSTGGTSRLPVEEVGFHYNKIEWEYFEVDAAGKPKGSIKTSYDLKTEKGS